mgnify:CR=1 FL=1
MISVRNIGAPDDIAACLEIYNYYIKNSTATFEEEPLSLDVFSRRIEKITRKYPFFVAENDGKVIGFAYLAEFNDRSAYRFTADLSVYLSHDEISRGVGSALLAAVEKAGKEIGIKQIISIITSENEKSLRFHEKHGFVKRGELVDVGYKFGRPLGVYYYQKTL